MAYLGLHDTIVREAAVVQVVVPRKDLVEN